MTKILIPAPEEEEQTLVEEVTDWKHIIFLPFHEVWEICLMISIVLNAMVSIYDLYFTQKTGFPISLLYYCCEMMYVIDGILSIMHRNMAKTRKNRSYPPRNLGVIIADCLTLHPTYEVRYFLSLTNYSTGQDLSKNYYKWKCVIRAYRMFIFERKLMNQVGLQQLVILPVLRSVKLAIIGQIFAAIIYVLIQKGKLNWTENLELYTFQRNSSVKWWSTSFMMMTGVVINNWPAFVKPENDNERITFISAMLIGFIISITLFLSTLVVIFMRINRSYFDYDLHVTMIMQLLDEWEVDNDLKSNTFDYYTMFYKQRKGIRNMPDLFKLLPPSLQKEVTVDIYWEALRHTHFFSKTDMSFKRSVSLVMKSEFLLPGEFLFRVGELKAKMVYLVSGVIQALSKEDDDSPLISFSSGTVLGETTCLMSCSSASNLRAVTYCEIQCLYLRDLYQVLSKYPTVAHTTLQELDQRLRIAKVGINEKRSHHSDAEYTDTSIKNVKDRWKEIWKFSKKADTMPVVPKEQRIDCMVANLDLLVLSRNVELRVESICLSGRCPFMMDPETSFRKCCDYIVIFAIIVQGIIIPKAAFFQENMSYDELSICVFMDAVYVLDIYLQLSTAVKHKNRLITDFKELVILLLKKVTFIVDIIAIFPTDYILMITDYEVNIAISKIPRLFKIYKIFTVILALQYNITVNTTVVRVLKWFILYLVTVYWSTWLLYGLSRLDTVGLTFWESIVLTLSCYIGYGGSNIYTYSSLEMSAYFIMSIIGHFISCFGLAELVATAVLRRKNNDFDTLQWWVINNELVRQKLDPNINKRLARFLYFNHSVKDCQIVGQHSIFADAPAELRNEVVRHRIIDCVKKIPLFQNAKRDVLRYICAHAEIKLVPPGAIVMDTEVKSDTLYVVMRGYCTLSSFLPGDLERSATSVLEIGDTFPLLETLHGTFSFVKVQCLTVVELLLIQTNIVSNALQTNETDYLCFKEALTEHRNIYGSILYRKGARLPPMTSLLPSKGKGNIFEYDIHDIDDIEFNETIYKKPFQDLGMWSLIRYFLMKRTIRPTSWPYISWEITRCVVLIAYFAGLNIRYSILSFYQKGETLAMLSLFFDGVALLDLYVRLHCQYYNERGILVTHPLYTAKHYIKTAFIMDCLGCVQIHNTGLDRVLGAQYALWVQLTVSVCTRCCQLYRPFKGLAFLDSYCQGKIRNAVNMFRYVLLILLCVSLGCTFTMLVMCDHSGHILLCDIRNKSSKYPAVYQCIYYMYTVTICVTLSSTGAVLENYRHFVLTVIILVPMVALKWLFFVSVTSRGVGGNVELTIYRDRMRNYMKFLKGALISDEDKQLIVTHYEYIWKKTHGLNMHSVIKNFHPQLEQDLARSIYHNCLKRVQLFTGEHISLFQAIAFSLRQEHYTKDSTIIRCNDIHTKLFFVHDGKVDIYIAGTLMCTLTTGGVFGCFSKTGVTRQTINAVTKIHSLMLTVDTKLFYKTVEAFPKTMERLQRATDISCEYMQESQHSRHFHEQGPRFQTYTKHHSFYKNVLIFENNPTYCFFNYVTNVHIYPLTSIMILTAIFVNLYDTHPSYILYVCYFTDFVHLFKMCCKCHLIYIDPESGRVISDPYLIRKKYLRSEFWFDFFTLLPFEFVADCYTDSGVIYNLCFLNRSLRFLMLVLYYYQCEERLLMKDHLKWTYMIYSVLFQLHTFLCLWLLVACPHTKCWYRSGFLPTDNNVTESQTTMESTILSYLYVINIYTGTGLKSMFPMSIAELIVTLAMMIITQVLIMNLCANYISHMLVNKHNFINYEVEFQSLGNYLQNLELSPFLYSKVRKYCLRLWNRERGNWLPVLITESPPFLKENVLQILYGRHLSNHYLFCNTHVDFLRQLVVHLDRFVFSAGDSIVEKGDADCCMYFINSGDIVQLKIYGKVEHYVGTLVSGNSFGEAQGLLCIPHKYAYRSRGDSEVLILNKSKWEYLLKWFPASKEQIITKGRQHGLFEADATI